MLTLVPEQIEALKAENMRSFRQRAHMFVRSNLPQQDHWTDAFLDQCLARLLVSLEGGGLNERDLVTFLSASLLYKPGSPDQREAAQYLAARCALPPDHVLTILEGV